VQSIGVRTGVPGVPGHPLTFNWGPKMYVLSPAMTYYIWASILTDVMRIEI